VIPVELIKPANRQWSKNSPGSSIPATNALFADDRDDTRESGFGHGRADLFTERLGIAV